jgi:hypothetical protein
LYFPVVGKRSSREGGIKSSKVEGPSMGKDKTKSNKEECVWRRKSKISSLNYWREKVRIRRV